MALSADTSKHQSGEASDCQKQRLEASVIGLCIYVPIRSHLDCSETRRLEKKLFLALGPFELLWTFLEGRE